MREFGYYILFGACGNEGNHCETTVALKINIPTGTVNLKLSNKISLHHAISIISMASKMREADEGPLTKFTVPLETMGPFAANLPRSIRGFDLRFHLGKTSSNRNKNLGFT